jgi:hypothetical protein
MFSGSTNLIRLGFCDRAAVAFCGNTLLATNGQNVAIIQI